MCGCVDMWRGKYICIGRRFRSIVEEVDSLNVMRWSTVVHVILSLRL